jgi:phosphoglycerate dehydrogenase-like enzyme
MKVLLTRPFFTEDLAYIRERLNASIQLLYPESYTDESLISYAKDVDALFGGYISRPLLDAATKLQFIQVPWTGVDNLDFELLKEKQIILCNSHSNSLVVAEHAIAMMFDAAKKLTYHDRLLRQGIWNRPGKDNKNEINPFSIQISNSNVCIIGFGAIGSKIADMLSVFNCSINVVTKGNIVTYNNKIRVFAETKQKEALQKQKFVFIAVPLTPDTRGMIDDEFFSVLDKNSVLINISRGEIVNEKSLFYALKERRIAFAAIDTWFNYPTKEAPIVFPSKNYPFHELNNIIMSPHRAGFSESGFPHLDDAIANLNAFFEGKELINVVNLKERF